MGASPAYALTVEQASAESRKIAAGDFHSLAVRPDGGVWAWGDDAANQTDFPAGLDGVVAVAAGGYHSIALKSDGTLVGWGGGDTGWEAYVPSGIDDALAISAGKEHSLVLRQDKTVVAAGSNSWGQCNVPPDLSNVAVVAAGGLHSLALKSDRTVVAWGRNVEGQCTVPPGLTNVVAVAAGESHSLALKDDGTVVAWGRTDEQQCTVPPGLSDEVVVAIAAGLRHSLALKSDGTVVAWGGVTAFGTTDPSVAVPAGLTDVVAISGGHGHSLAMRSNGTFVGWGNNVAGQCFGRISIHPGPDSYNVPVDQVFSVGFSATALPGPQYDMISLRDSAGSPVPIFKALSGHVLTITPTSPLKNNTTYALAIPAGSVRDAYGSANPGYSFNYTTPDTLPPVIESVDLPDGTGEDPGSQAVRIHFNEGVYAGPSFDGIVLRDAGGSAVDTSVTIGGYRQRVLTVTPVTLLDLEQSFTLTIPAGAVSDESGNILAAKVEIDIGGITPPPTSISIAGTSRFHTAVAASQEAYPLALTTSSSPRAATGLTPLAARLWQERSMRPSCFPSPPRFLR
jgi:alpha-tubulin suppressor-like RCC1 family protein